MLVKKLRKRTTCEMCEKPLTGRQEIFCSESCQKISNHSRFENGKMVPTIKSTSSCLPQN